MADHDIWLGTTSCGGSRHSARDHAHHVGDPDIRLGTTSFGGSRHSARDHIMWRIQTFGYGPHHLADPDIQLGDTSRGGSRQSARVGAICSSLCLFLHLRGGDKVPIPILPRLCSMMYSLYMCNADVITSS